eukprot:ANDGO_00691.mRNA.1 hypothetical protein
MDMGIHKTAGLVLDCLSRNIKETERKKLQTQKVGQGFQKMWVVLISILIIVALIIGNLPLLLRTCAHGIERVQKFIGGREKPKKSIEKKEIPDDTAGVVDPLDRQEDDDLTSAPEEGTPADEKSETA